MESQETLNGISKNLDEIIKQLQEISDAFWKESMRINARKTGLFGGITLAD